MLAADAPALAALPIGLAHGARLPRDVSAGAPVRWQDVAFDAESDALRVRKHMEADFPTGS